MLRRRKKNTPYYTTFWDGGLLLLYIHRSAYTSPFAVLQLYVHTPKSQSDPNSTAAMTAGILSQSTLLSPSPRRKTLTPPRLLPSSVSLPSHKPFLSHGSPSLRMEDRIMTKLPTAVSENSSAVSPVDLEKKTRYPIVVIDNYDSFTYNLCQVGLVLTLFFV